MKSRPEGLDDGWCVNKHRVAPVAAMKSRPEGLDDKAAQAVA